MSGRPRSQRADQAILRATLALLLEQGYDGMSIEAVASAAGVGKPTIYRRYASKRELVIAAVSSLAESMPQPPHSGDVRADLLGYIEPAFAVFNSGIGFAMLGALLVKEREDPELMVLFRTRVVQPRLDVLVDIIQRGIEVGQVRPRVHVEIAADMLVGALFAAHVAGHAPDAAWLRALIDSTMAGIAAPNACSMEYDAAGA